jgi:hypothetical protein
MATAVFDWEAVGNGAAATAANTGISPNNPSPGAGGAITGTTDAVVGAIALKFENGTTASCIMQVPTVAATQLAVSTVIKMPAGPPPTVNNRLYAIYGAGTARAYIVLTPTGVLKAGGQGGAGEANMAGGASMAPYYGTWCRIEFEWNSGTTTADGTLVARFYPTAFSTSQVGTAFSNTAINVGAGVAASEVRIGVTTVQAVTGMGYTQDTLQIADGTAVNPGPPATAGAPSVNAGASQYPVAGATVTLTSTESGTFSSGTWTCTEFPYDAASPSIAAPANATTTVVLPTHGRYVFRRSLVWTGGTATSSVTEYVHPAAGGDVLVYGEFDTSAAWANDGAAVDRTHALNDLSTATGIASQDNPTNQEKKFIMRPADLGALSGFAQGYSRLGTLTRTITLYLEDGTTVVDSWVHTPGLEISNISEPQDDVDAAGLALITTLASRRALVVGFKSTV